MTYINKYNNLAEYDADNDRALDNTVSFINNENRIIYIPKWDGTFEDPEVIRILFEAGLVANQNHSSGEELASITSLDSYFHKNKVITQFPELKYCTGLTSLSDTFYECSSLTTAPVIPEGVTNLSGTFADCSSLTTAPTIPEGVTSLQNTFANCSSLTTAPVIPSSVTNLLFTFSGCSSLTTAPIIPEGVTNLASTFRDCSSIDGVFTIEAVSPPSSYNAFSGVAVQAIYVPDESVDAYKAASYWRNFSSRIYPMSDKPQ